MLNVTVRSRISNLDKVVYLISQRDEILILWTNRLNGHLLASRKTIVRDAMAGGVSVPPLTGGCRCVSTAMMNI